MESLLVATRVVLPMAMLVVIGVIVRLTGVSDRATMKRVDNLIFKVTMPMVSFYNLYKTDFSQMNNLGYILFATAGMLLYA